MLTIAYVRVSTDDQVEHSPEAQRRRCAEYARSKGLDTPRLLSDEGWSGKNLDRPAMQELIGSDRGRSGREPHRVAHRSTQSGFRRCEPPPQAVRHALRRRPLDLTRATSSRSQRPVASRRTSMACSLNSNARRSSRTSRPACTSCIRDGYWLNTPPIGYDLIDRVLVANDDAYLVKRAFAIRASGGSYPDVARATGLKYGTARHLLGNRVYLGEVCIRDAWFPGRHDPIVSEAEFEAAQRGHVPGRRRGSDLLTGRVRCGVCGKLTAIDTNGRGRADLPMSASRQGLPQFPADRPPGFITQHDSASSFCATMTS